MSVVPAAKNCSASFRVETVMPEAPAARCAAATGTLLLVFTWGRRRTPCASMRCCMRAMLRCMRSRSITAAGVSRVRSVSCMVFLSPSSIQVLAFGLEGRHVVAQSLFDQGGDRGRHGLLGRRQLHPQRGHLCAQARIAH